jgi:hypothetical protein
MKKNKIPFAVVTEGLNENLDLLNEKFSDRQFRIKYYSNPKNITTKVILEYKHKNDKRWWPITNPLSKYDLFDAIKIFYSGAYMAFENNSDSNK